MVPTRLEMVKVGAQVLKIGTLVFSVNVIVFSSHGKGELCPMLSTSNMVLRVCMATPALILEIGRPTLETEMFVTAWPCAGLITTNEKV